jgi:hypothetical protein
MKLKYEKPLIAVEQYALSQAIAACQTQVGYNDNICMANDEDVPLLMREMAAIGMFGEGRCVEPPYDMDFEDNVCYHTSANPLFCS